MMVLHPLPRSVRVTCAGVAAALLLAPPLAQAATPASFVAIAEQPLRFGTLVVSGSGSRTVGPDGSTTNNAVFPLGDSASGPAEFTMTYTRASGDSHFYQLLIQVTLPSTSTVNVNSVQGNLASFTTDLPGLPTLLPGQSGLITINNCVTATCSVTFHIGGTLNVASGSKGAALTFPLMLMTTVTAVLG
jgi:hypothetical protein